MDPARPQLHDLRQEALDAARGVSLGEAALVEVLRDLEQERSRAVEAYQAVVRSLAAALEARDGYTGEHSDEVRDLSTSVARTLGLEPRALAEVEAVAMLHDIGKIGVPDQVLHKPGPLDQDEWELMRQHPVIGERILRPLPGLGNVATAVRHEHERWDGNGYPDGLAGEQIPLASRIVLACDAYHALVSDRPYRKALATGHAQGELRRCAGSQFDPAVVEALLDCLEHPRTAEPPVSDDLGGVLADPAGEGQEQRLERELHGLIAVASAVGAAHRLEDVVEVAAEQAMGVIDATSMSVSQWDRQGRDIRTLINVGELGEAEERWPRDERYPYIEGDRARILLQGGEAFRFTRDEPGIPDSQQALLVELGRRHCIGVPILFAGRPWGELWATRTDDQPAFADRDERFLLTIAGQIAAAVGRSELFSRMAELAFEDPLTGVANRRALDERLEEAVERALATDTDLTVLLCDVDNLKELNDAEGHDHGDRALVRVAEVLGEAVSDSPDALVARIGGDEFGVLLEGVGADTGRAIGEDVLELLRHGDGPVLTVSCGVASIGLGARRPGELLRSADAAQYTAKRGGRARVAVADLAIDDRFVANASERRTYRRETADDTVLDVGALIERVTAALDGPLARGRALDRLETVALACGEAADATALAVSWWAEGELVDTVFSADRRSGRAGGRRFGSDGEKYELRDFPVTERVMREGGSFRVAAADPDCDRAEAELLEAWGMDEVVGAGVPGIGESWLVEIYADGRTSDLPTLESTLRLLVAEAVRGAREPAERLRSVG